MSTNERYGLKINQWRKSVFRWNSTILLVCNGYLSARYFYNVTCCMILKYLQIWLGIAPCAKKFVFVKFGFTVPSDWGYVLLGKGTWVSWRKKRIPANWGKGSSKDLFIYLFFCGKPGIILRTPNRREKFENESSHNTCQYYHNTKVVKCP